MSIRQPQGSVRSDRSHNAAPSTRIAGPSGPAPRKPAATHRTPRTPSHEDKADPKMVGPWRIGRTIGKGSSGQPLTLLRRENFTQLRCRTGRVRIVKHVHTAQLAAVKIVPKHALMSSRMSINEAGAKVIFLVLLQFSHAKLIITGGQVTAWHRARDCHNEAH